jgi:hypothetical protein
MPSAFPTKIMDFNSYLAMVTSHLKTHKARLGIDSVKLAALISLYGDQTTTDTYLYNFFRWADKANGKTQTVNTNLRSISKTMKTMLADIYNDIPASKWTDDDRLNLNRKKGLAYNKTSHNTRIELICVPAIEFHQNGRFKIAVRSSNDSGRSSIPTGADAVEVAYAILEGSFRVNTENNPKVKKTCFGPDDDTQHQISFRAKFFLEVDPKLAGYELHLWFRWIHTRHPSRAGHWSTQVDVPIS